MNQSTARANPLRFRVWVIWTPKRIALLIGFLLSMIGALAPQFYTGATDSRIAAADGVARALSDRIENLRAAQSQYLSIQQMGALVLSLSLSGTAAAQSAQEATLDRLYQLSFIDRSFSVRQMLGELALAGRLSYRETSDKYAALILDARQRLSMDTYRNVDDFEAEIVRNSNAWMVQLQSALEKAQQTKSELDAQSARRKLQLLIVSTIGSSLLLIANLLSEKPSISSNSAEAPYETAIAEELAARLRGQIDSLATNSDRQEDPLMPKTDFQVLKG